MPPGDPNLNENLLKGIEGISAALKSFEQRLEEKEAAARNYSKVEKLLDFILKYSSLFGAIGAAGLVVYGGIIGWESSQKLIVTTQEQIARVTGGAIPERTIVSGIGGTTNQAAQFAVSLHPDKIGDTVYYVVYLEAMLHVGVDGHAGLLVGMTMQASGTLLDTIAVDMQGNES